ATSPNPAARHAEASLSSRPYRGRTARHPRGPVAAPPDVGHPPPRHQRHENAFHRTSQHQHGRRDGGGAVVVVIIVTDHGADIDCVPVPGAVPPPPPAPPRRRGGRDGLRRADPP